MIFKQLLSYLHISQIRPVSVTNVAEFATYVLQSLIRCFYLLLVEITKHHLNTLHYKRFLLVFYYRLINFIICSWLQRF